DAAFLVTATVVPASGAPAPPVRPIATFGAQRNPRLPGVPTFQEEIGKPRASRSMSPTRGCFARRWNAIPASSKRSRTCCTDGPRTPDPLRELHLQLQLQADAVPGARPGAVFVSHGQPQDRQAEGAGIPGDQPVGRGAVAAPPGADDPPVERDPRLPGAHDRAFRGQDRAAALAG